MVEEIFLPFPRLQSTWREKTLSQHALNHGQQRIYPKPHTHFFRCRSFSPLMIFTLFAVILVITGDVVEGANATRVSKLSMSGSKTSTAIETSCTGDMNGDDGDEEGLHVSGSGDLPMPFDTNIGSNTFISTTCPAFFSLFLNDPDYRDCLPLSAMLQNSQSFFDTTRKSGFATSQILDLACSADFDKCKATMEFYAEELKLPERCGTEIEKNHQLTVQAYASFVAYPSLFKAGCLKSDTGSYCYVDAVTNVTNPDDPHIYFIPLGLKLPGGSRPTCSLCLQETMNIFHDDAGNSSLPLSETYLPAAYQLNIGCGPGFTNTSLVKLYTAEAPRTFRSVSTLAAIVILAIITFFI